MRISDWSSDVCSSDLCSVALAVNELHDSPFARDELVQVCIQAENDGVGAPTGGMDQTIALFAQPSTALLLDCQDGSTEPIPFELHGAGYELIEIGRAHV